MEIWRDIIGYEKIYKISNLGNIKSFKNGKWGLGKEKLLKLYINNTGYYFTNLSGKELLISRLVAQAFLGLDINNRKIFVCHKDDNPLNNNVENLFLGTHKDNMQDCYNKLRHYTKGKFGKEHPRSIIVIQFDKNLKKIKEWGAIREIQYNLGIPRQNIIACCKGRLKSAGGFIWKYN